MNWLTNLVSDVKNDEAWVVAEIQKGWAALQTAEQTIAVDIEGVFNWIATHQSQIQGAVTKALEGITVAGAVVPGAAPYVAPAVAALDAAQVVIDQLAAANVTGSTPLSTIVNAYHATKDAATAAAPLLKAATTKPSA